MGKFVDLTGMKFGRWTVIKKATDKEYKRPHWICQCECGNVGVVSSYSLKSGNSKSCGCYHKDKVSEMKSKDLTGQKFGRLTVIERAGSDKHGKAHWICECECGTITQPIATSSLTSGNSKSCGCYHKDRVRETVKILNEDEDYRKMQSEKMKELSTRMWQDEDYRKMHSEKQKAKTGEKHPNWKGGITPISAHLRVLNEQWFEDCKEQVNYTCQLTGKRGNGNLHTHHLYSFSSIVKDAHDKYDISIKQQVKDYTEEELKLLEEYVASWHKDNSNAVVLCEDVHRLFHHVYGSKDNTPQQFEEFKQRYLNGEFENSDSNNNKVA